MEGVTLRLGEFLRHKDGRGIVVDTSAGLTLGALPGLEDFDKGIRPLLMHAEGVVCSPGQLRRISARTYDQAALLVRVDWTNTLRGPDFVLPPTDTRQVSLLSARDAFDLGAVAMVADFLLGYQERIESECMRACVEWAMEGKSLGLPLVVQVRANGPRVAIPDKAVELGVSYALEAGADVIVVPYAGPRAIQEIGQFTTVPWLVKPTSMQAENEIVEALGRGASGVWVDHALFAEPHPATTLQRLNRLVHRAVGV